MRRRLRLVVLTCALAAGCGGDDDPPRAAATAGTTDAAILVQSAFNRSDRDRSYRSAVALRTDATDERTSIAGTLVSDPEGKRLRGTIRAQQGDERYTADLVSVGGTTYLRSDDRAWRAPGGKWRRMKRGEIGVDALAPAEFFQVLLISDGGDIVGHETIRGQRTARVRGVVDPANLFERTKLFGPLGDRVSREERSQLEVRYDAWITEERPTLQRLWLTLTVDGEDGDVQVRTDLLERDVPLDDIAPPPLGQVVAAR